MRTLHQCTHDKHHAQKPSIPSQQMLYTIPSRLWEAQQPQRARRVSANAEQQAATLSTHAQPSHHLPPGIIAETRHPGTADAAHRHARAGLQERNGPKPTRGARATRPATSQHRVGRRRRSSDDRRRTLLFARELLDAFQQRELRCRYFLLV